MKNDAAKKLKEWERIATRPEHGWRVEKPRGGHWKWFAPDGVTIVTTPSTPGRGRSINNIRGTFARNGLVVN